MICVISHRNVIQKHRAEFKSKQGLRWDQYPEDTYATIITIQKIVFRKLWKV